jgi:hypothetical protein
VNKVNDNIIEISDDCDNEGCDGKYEYSFNGGGTCNKCGNCIPCF